MEWAKQGKQKIYASEGPEKTEFKKKLKLLTWKISRTFPRCRRLVVLPRTLLCVLGSTHADVRSCAYSLTVRPPASQTALPTQSSLCFRDASFLHVKPSVQMGFFEGLYYLLVYPAHSWSERRCAEGACVFVLYSYLLTQYLPYSKCSINVSLNSHFSDQEAQNLSAKALRTTAKANIVQSCSSVAI